MGENGVSHEARTVLETSSVRLTRKGRRLLDDLSLSLAGPGRVSGILGANGAGKTCLLRVVTGLMRPDSGEVRVLGRAVPAGVMPERVGALIEEPRFYPWLSGRDNLLVAAAGRSAQVDRIDRILADVGLETRAGDTVRVYSQGMRQRLGIGRALLSDPQLLLLDEPANGLDPDGIVWLRDLLLSLGERGTSVVVTSHVLTEVQRTCDTVVVLSGGRCVAGGDMGEVLSDFASLEDLYFSLGEREHAGSVRP